MRTEEIKTRFEQLCVDHLGADMGPRVAALARHGFSLTPVGGGEASSGRFRFGGPALLDPGTSWPTFEDAPMHLLAVVDTDALVPWLDADLPAGAGLLNVFYIGHEDSVERDVSASRQVRFEAPLDCRVIPADPATASEVPHPVREAQLPVRPVRADPILALPDSTRAFNSPDLRELNGVDLWDAFVELQARLPELLDGDLLRIRNLPEDEDAAEEYGAYEEDNEHRAFGWPWAMQGSPTPDNARVHLLQLDTDQAWTWADCGMISLDLPAEALRAGDFGKVYCELASC